MTNSPTASTTRVRRLTMAGLLVTMGIVFGDIGTSPLYVMNAITHVQPDFDADYIIGAISCIIWTLTLQTTVKYVLVALRADNRGEGGILALFSLIRKLKRRWLYIVAALGAATLIADGVITPAVTVTSAVEGLRGIVPNAPVVVIAIVIITIVFAVQRFGTNAIGRFFGPFMLLWFAMLGVLGAMHIGADVSVLKAFNPLCAIRLLMHSPVWFLILGAVFLCTTGAEALYSDLGHCGRRNISVAWLFVKVCLILNYLGQGAWLLSVSPASVADVNPFYALMSQGFLPVGVVMSTCAAVIASQALISGSFTIFSEAIGLDFWPRLRIDYPTTVRGQLYIPFVNIFLWVGCIAAVLIFRSSQHMEAAYGLAITITMLMTTVLLCVYLAHKGVNRILVALFGALFGSLEAVFFAANATKFMHGGWFTMLIAAIVFAVMLIWYRATILRSRFFDYVDASECLPVIADIKADDTIPYYAANVIYISHSPAPTAIESKVLYSIVNKQPKRACHYWFLRMQYSDAPDTLEYRVTPLLEGTAYSIELNIGFRVRPQVSVYLRQVVEDLVREGRIDLVSPHPALSKRSIPGNFRFTILHRIFSPASSCTPAQRWLLTMYERLRVMARSDESALGLDTSNLTVENVPLILNTAAPRRITRV